MASAPIEQSPSPELEPTPPEVKRYQRQKLTAQLGSLGLNLSLLVIMAVWGGPKLDQLLRPFLGENRWLRLIALAFVYAASMELLTLPLDFWSGFVLEHRYQLSNQTFFRWVWRQIKGYLIGGPIGLMLLLGFYSLFWYAGPWWWLWAAAGWLAVTLILGQILPVVILPLFYKVTALGDSALMERLQRVANGTGLNIQGVYRLHLSAETRKANAALAGLGHTRRVLLGDTLLDQFTPDEIEVVFAHEVGHHVHRHLLKMVVWGVLTAGASFWLADRVLRAAAPALGYAPTELLPAYQDPSALPLLLVVLSLFGLVLAPLQNAVSRFFERQCDRYALERTGLAQAYRSAFTKLARINKSDPDPHPIVVWLFEDHPPIRRRMAMADVVIPHQSEAVAESGPTASLGH
ncbi:MAG TPA: M48 family metalloprotease [Gemmataceae bacterium]|nr:M48 family metalloprotease [Gemmataceae bacterium]